MAAARGLVAADAAAPFDLAAGPLIRASVIRLGPAGHVLALSMHHVVSDEWSAGIFRRELGVLYAAFGRGEPDPLPPLVVQYADFAVWQRRWLAGEVLAGQLAYWRGRLAGAPVLELPADRPRPPVRSTAGAVAQFSVPAEVAAGLRAVARGGGATMFMTLLAAYAVLLGRYSGQDDVVVGTPAANRNHAGTEDLIGFFVNTLVLRADLSGDPEFTGLLGRVREVALGAYAHQDLPFEQLVDALVSDRDRSRTPLFQVFFNYAQTGGGDAAGRGGGQATGAEVRRLPALFDLTLSVADAGEGGLSGGIEYSTALFDHATVERMCGHLVALLEAVAADAGRPLSGLVMVTEREHEQLAGWGAGAAVVVPAAGGIHELVAARAAACPDAVAVVCGEESLTYAELEERADLLARYLRHMGAGVETVVGLCLDRGMDLVVAALAVWKAGGAYLPLDPGYPAERLAFMLADSGAAVLVGHRRAAVGLTGGAADAAGRGVAEVWLDDPATAAGIAGCPGGPPAVATASAGLAGVIYTSGTTGRPKGTLISHGSLAAVYAAWASMYFGPSDAYRWLSLASASFDVFTGDLVRALCSGGTLVLGPVGLQLSVSEWVAVLAGERINALECAPRYADELVGHLERADVLLEDLRLLVVTTDVWRTAAAARARRILGPAVRILAAYGITETTIDSTCSGLTGPDGLADPASTVDRPAPIGRPLPGTRLYTLDRYLNPVPVAAAGELFIGGAGVARGYGGRPALTAGRFVADPFAGDGSRVYRTGDRVRWMSGGELEFLGRADDQVKVRGFRVEPGEVEAVLAAHRGVRAAVVAASGQGDDHRLVAYLVPADPAEGIPPVSELRAFLQQRLPDFMIPAAFTELAALPLTVNGKLDRAALPSPDDSRPELAGGYVAALTPAEELVAGIWAQVLGVDRVGVGDSFFDLGGHSLLATQVISRVRRVFGVEIPLAALFDQPTVARLAAVIRDVAPGVAAPPVTAVGRDQLLPLSFAQQRLWFLDQLEPDSSVYNVPMSVRLAGDLDVAALDAALGRVAGRHEVLRTRLVAGPDGVAHQVIDPPALFPLPVADVSGRNDPLAAARQLVAADAAAPI